MNRLEAFLDVYRNLDGANVGTLATVYSTDIHFTDPAHDIRGLAELQRYIGALYADADAVEFRFGSRLEAESEAFVRWTMLVRHPRLKRGGPVEVAGASFLRFNRLGKVFRHQDYFDLGALLYEHVPLVGSLVTTIKRRLGR